MRIATRCLPVGALPYKDIKHTTAMMAKLFSETPFLALLPNISNTETVVDRVFENIPGITYSDGNVVLNAGGQNYKEDMKHLSDTFNKPSINHLEKYRFDAHFLEKYLQMIKKFKSTNAFFNILGPFTVSQILNETAQGQILVDKSYKKLFIHAVCVKALWMIEKIKETCPTTVPVIILEESMLSQLGMIKREKEDTSNKLVVDLISQVTNKLQQAGAIVGVQCMEKCDWSIPIKAGVDFISFDAYNNPNNLTIIPELLIDFIRKGGMINWGIIPVLSDEMVKGLTIDYLYKRLSSTIGGTILAGVPAELLYNSALISLNGDMDKLSVFFAEKAILLANQLGSKLLVRN